MTVYNFFKKMPFKYIFFANLIIGILIFYIPNIPGKFSEISLRLQVGNPILIGLISTYIIYLNNKNNYFVKFLLFSLILYVLICSSLIIFELNFLKHYSAIELLNKLFEAQFIYGLYLIVITKLFEKFKEINKIKINKIIIFYISGLYCFPIKFPKLIEFLLSLLIRNLVSGLFIGILIISTAFNPILIYILSSIAKGKLLTEDKNNLKENDCE